MAEEQKRLKEKFSTPVMTARWPKLVEPNTRFDADGKFEVELVGPEDDEEIQALIKTAEKLRDKHFASLDAKKRKTYKKAPVFTEDLDEEGEPTGNVVIKCTMKHVFEDRKTGRKDRRWPRFFDSMNREVPRKKLKGGIWGGSQLAIGGFVQPYDMGSSKLVGVSYRLSVVQIIELVQGGGADPSQFGMKARDEGGFSADGLADDDGDDDLDDVEGDGDDGGDDDDF